MNTYKKHNAPIVETSAAIQFFLDQVRGGTIVNFVDALSSVDEFATSERMRGELDPLLDKAERIERALESFIKLRVPRLPACSHKSVDIFSTVSARIENCPLHNVINVIDGLKEICPEDHEHASAWSALSDEDIQIELSLGMEINGFLQDFDAFLEKLSHDDLDDYDHKKELLEKLAPVDPEALPVPFPKAAKLTTKTTTIELPPKGKEPTVRKWLGSAEIHDTDYDLHFDEAANRRLWEAEGELQAQAEAEGREIDLRDRITALIWAGLIDEQRNQFPTVHHFRGYFDGASKDDDALAIPLGWLDYLETPQSLRKAR